MVGVVAVAMVVTWWQQQRWRWQRWATIGGKSGQQQERQWLHDGMR
jgi:hypothetical protein